MRPVSSRTALWLTCLSLLAALLAGCGLKGDLYLPERAQPAPAAQHAGAMP